MGRPDRTSYRGTHRIDIPTKGEDMKKGEKEMKLPAYLFFCIALSCNQSCTSKRTQLPPETMSDKEAIASDTIGKDSIRYIIPECFLLNVQDLLEEREDTSVVMWTELPVYGTDVQGINVFVENPTTTSLTYGRDWHLYRWNGKEWVMPKVKGPDIAWFSDGFNNRKAPLRYCFCFPIGRYYHLSKGKYRIQKSFYADRREIALNAEFEIK